MVDVVRLAAGITGIGVRQIKGNCRRCDQGIDVHLIAQLFLVFVQCCGVFFSTGKAAAVDADGTLVHQNNTVSDLNRVCLRLSGDSSDRCGHTGAVSAGNRCSGGDIVFLLALRVFLDLRNVAVELHLVFTLQALVAFQFAYHMLEVAATGNGVLVVVHPVCDVIAAFQCVHGKGRRCGKLAVFFGGFCGAIAHQQKDGAAENDGTNGKDSDDCAHPIGNQNLSFQFIASLPLSGGFFVLRRICRWCSFR